MPSNFQLLPTPNPDEFMFSITVPDRKINPELLLGQGSTLQAGVTTYREFLWAVCSERANEAWGTYIYVKCGKSSSDGMAFYFGKPKTEEERNTPFNTWADTQQYTWPAVLYDLYAVQTSTYPMAINNGSKIVTTPRILPRFRYEPEYTYNSTIIIRQYLAPTPWEASELEHEQPIETAVHGSYIGVDMDFVKCLHPTIVFPEQNYNAQIVVGVGVENPPPGRNPNRLTIPATNFLYREAFFLKDSQQYVDGMFLRESIEIFPPPVDNEVLG